MDKIWCEVRAATVAGALRFRGIVHMGSAATWRGNWREKQIEALRDAEKAAEKFYDLNHNVLTIARTFGPGSAVSGPGKYRRSADHAKDGPLGA